MTRTKFGRTTRLVIGLLCLVVAIEVVVPLGLLLGRDHLLFFPWGGDTPESRLAAFDLVKARVVHVARPDGRKLVAYDAAPRQAAADLPVVLFLHGNAGNIATRAELAAWFVETANVRLLLLDYSGYGGNAGSPSESEINTDALAAFDHLVADGVPASRIVVLGESIGGAPALFVASSRPVAGVAVQSTFSSLSSMALRVYPWLPLASLFVKGSFPSAERIAKLTCPVLVVHGTADRIVPFSEGERLHAAAPAGTEFLRVAGADHNDLFDVAGGAYLAGLGERFRRWTSR